MSRRKTRKTNSRQQLGHRSVKFRSFRSAFGGGRPKQAKIKKIRYHPPAADYSRTVPKLHLSGKGLAALLLVLLLFAAVRSGRRMLEHSDTFRVQKIMVQGNRVTSEHQLLALADIKIGMPMLSFRTDAAEKRIRQHLWVARVRIERSWPDTVEIQVYEHQPMAMINIEHEHRSDLYYADQNGTVFAPVGQSQDLDFPVITGVSLPEGQILGADLTGHAAAGDAVQFLRLAALGNPVLPLQAVSEIHVLQKKGIIVYLAASPFPIYVGYGNLKNRYSQLIRLLGHLYQGQEIENIREIHMDYQAGRILAARLEP